MKKLVDKVFHHAARLDSAVDAFVTDKMRGDRVLTPAELLAAIVAQVGRGVTVGPDGPLFPYNAIGVTLSADSVEREAELRGALPAESVRLAIVATLRRQVAVPADLRVKLRVVTKAGDAPPFATTLRNVEPRHVAAPEPTVAKLTSSDGAARFTLGEGVFNIGRVAEIVGRDGKMIRRNQIVLDSGDDGATVSRMHARIQGTRSGESVTFVLFDEGSRRGSTVVRGGRPHKVVQGSVGFRLKDGDELYFGKMRLLFKARRA